jgi:hypothetical protein
MTTLTAQLAATLNKALAEACHRVGLDPAGARLITYSSNAVYKLAGPVVVRLNLHPQRSVQTAGLVRAARWLAQNHAPIAPLVEDIDQPAHGSGYSATFWHACKRATDLEARDLAVPLSVVHGLDAPVWLPCWGKFSYARG